jgi:hypothetical protein
LDFVNKTKKQIDKTENPFLVETQGIASFQKTTEKTFANDWKPTKDFISKTYNKQTLDGDFYEKEFERALQPTISAPVETHGRASLQKQIVTAKQNKTKFHSLVIGTSQNEQVIKDFDNNWIYDANNQNRVLNLVKNIRTL